MTPPQTPPPEEDAQTRRANTAERMRKMRARKAELTKLELGFYDQLPTGYSPYTEAEADEAAAIRADLERVMKRAEGLRQRILNRIRLRPLSQEEQAVFLEVLDEAGSRVTLPPF